MSHHSTVALVTIAHEPNDRLAALVEAHLPALAARYAAVAAFCSQQTHPRILDLLQRYGALVELDDREPAGVYGLGQVRRKALQTGLQAGASHLQMCDFDRAIHWVAHYPAELESVIDDIPNYDLLVLGRTARAWATHPPYQAETEPLFNRVFSLVTGLAWDVGAGSRGLSRRAAALLLERSQEPTVGVDAEWPLLALQQDGLRVGHRLCEGLEFETADRFAREIEAAGGYQAWQTQMSADPARWAFRLRIVQMIADSAVKVGSMGRRENVVP